MRPMRRKPTEALKPCLLLLAMCAWSLLLVMRPWTCPAVCRLDTSMLPNRWPGPQDTTATIGPNDTVIYVITPTYAKLEQKAELTRMSHTLRLVPKLVWVLVEDTPHNSTSDYITRLLERSGIQYAHLTKASPIFLATNHPKGMAQRNHGLSWVRRNAQNFSSQGVVYFADDDNTYDLRLFEAMRTVKKVGIWAVAFSGGLKIEKPVVNGCHVVGWEVSYGDRKFPTDMAGFAINLKLLLGNKCEFDEQGHFTRSESFLLEQLQIELVDLEPVTADCHDVLVWHTNTYPPSTDNEAAFKRQHGVDSAHGWDV